MTTISRRIIETLLLFLSELEAYFVVPGDSLALRRLFLRYCGVSFTNPIWIGRKFRLLHGHNVSLGDRCALGDFVMIIAYHYLKIGDDFTGAAGLHIDTGGHDPVTMKPAGGPIVIGDRVWCGIDVRILGGVTIGDDVVIGAGSVVCRDIPSNSVAAGVPARVIRSIDRDLDEFWTWVIN
jgi:acetyltransferase-like isoleucine patch superfamily enzyme